MKRWRNDALFEISGDSREYEILYEAAKRTKEVEGLVAEIGIRRGGGTFVIMRGFEDIFQHRSRRFIGIDPYGHQNHDYTNDMMRDMKRNVFQYCWEKGIDFNFFNMEDTEFFERFSDGVPCYQRAVPIEQSEFLPPDEHWKQVINKYAFVHFDGPHDPDAVYREAKWFIDGGRINPGTVFAFDDIVGYYDHDKFENEVLFQNNFELIQKGVCKASYHWKG